MYWILQTGKDLKYIIIENYQIKLIAQQVTNYKIWVTKTGCECYFDNANNGFECLIIENIKCK